MMIEEVPFAWYERCVELSSEHPVGSFEYCFWWSLRTELDPKAARQWAQDPEQAIEDWFEYFKYKWEQLAPHREAYERGRNRTPDRGMPRAVRGTKRVQRMRIRRGPAAQVVSRVPPKR